MVILRTSGVDSTTASTLVQRDTENGDSIAQAVVAFTKAEETLLPDDSVKVMRHLIPSRCSGSI